MVRRFFTCDSGMALVEMAITMPFFCLLLVCVFDLGRMAYWQCAVTDSVHLGMQYASVIKPPTETPIINAMRNNLVATLSKSQVDAAGTATGARYFCICSNNLNSHIAPCGVTQTVSCPNGYLMHYATITTDLTYKPIMSQFFSMTGIDGHIRQSAAIQVAE